MAWQENAVCRLGTGWASPGRRRRKCCRSCCCSEGCCIARECLSSLHRGTDYSLFLPSWCCRKHCRSCWWVMRNHAVRNSESCNAMPQLWERLHSQVSVFPVSDKSSPPAPPLPPPPSPPHFTLCPAHDHASPDRCLGAHTPKEI